VRGVLHVHSLASDGRGTRAEIAAAAARAGLGFVVITDHGDATRRPEAPAYLSGVLMIDGVEVSTREGHYVAIGLPASPYPLGGESADVVDDVRRLGGFGIAAHPDSPKRELRWTDWSAPVDGVELLNPDTSWRQLAFGGGLPAKALLLRTLLAYPIRPAEGVAELFTDVTSLRSTWLTLAQHRAVVLVAGADAHAKLALVNTEPGDNRYSIPIPSYESSFESLSVHVTPDSALTGEAAVDAAAILKGLRAGHVYIAVEGWAAPPLFTFTAHAGSATGQAGDTLPAGIPLTLQVKSNAPPGFSTVVWKDAAVLTERAESSFDLSVGPEPAIYRVEVRRPNADGLPPWISSNPIYVRAPGGTPDEAGESAPNDQGGLPLFNGRTTEGWSHESDATSVAAVDVAPLVTGPRIRLRYGLAGGDLVGQYAAAAVDVPRGANSADGVAFSVRGEGPMRISVQVRAEVPGARPERWERSIYLTDREADRIVRFPDMRPVGQTHSPQPPAPAIRTIMFVVDTTNSKPGVSGQLWLGHVRLVRSR
jgi:hypothetical protein